MPKRTRVEVTEAVTQGSATAIADIVNWLEKNVSEDKTASGYGPYSNRTSSKYIKEGRRILNWGDGWIFYLKVGKIRVGSNGEWFVEFTRKKDAALFILRWS